MAEVAEAVVSKITTIKADLPRLLVHLGQVVLDVVEVDVDREILNVVGKLFAHLLDLLYIDVLAIVDRLRGFDPK